MKHSKDETPLISSGNEFCASKTAILLLLGGAAWLRLSGWRRVLISGELMPQGGDSAYHLRRIMLAAESFPRVPTFDPWMNWPEGGLCHWAPGMDFLGGGLVRGAGADPGTLSAAVLVSLLPVLFGVAAVWMVVKIAQELLSPQVPPYVPLGCGAVMAMLPQAVATSRFGRVDHHIFEVLCMGLLGLWVLRAVKGRPGKSWELFGGLILFSGLATFAGSVLYAAIAAGLLLALRLFGPREQDAGLVGSGAPAFACAALATLALYGRPVSDPFSYVFPSFLQPSLLTLAAFVLWGASKARLAGAVVATVLGLSVFLAFDAPRQELVGGLTDWLAHKDPWLAGISEFQPLLREGLFSTSSWGNVGRYFGLFGILGLPMVLVTVITVARFAPRKALVFGMWTAVVVGLTLLQNRFGRIATVNLALCAGLSSFALARRLVGHSTLATKSLLGHRITAATFFALVFFLAIGSPGIRSQVLPAPARAFAAVEEAALFLREETSPESDSPGVAAPWDFGHFLLWTARRPVVATGFGTYLSPEGFQQSSQVQLGSEAQAVAWMRTRNLDHLVAGAATFSGRVGGGEAGPPLVANREGLAVLNPGFTQVFPMAVSLVGGSGIPAAGTPHFEVLRPVFASTAVVPRAGIPMPSLWVYRRVPPQRLEGIGQPGDQVFARIELTVRGTPWPWAAVTTVGRDGRWSLDVPLALGSVSGGIHTPDAFSVRIGAHPPVLLSLVKDKLPVH